MYVGSVFKLLNLPGFEGGTSGQDLLLYPNHEEKLEEDAVADAGNHKVIVNEV